jgi:hypothetical protein
LTAHASKRLNDIVTATLSSVVVSSAWRYMILNGAMTVKGFEYLLAIHGFIGKVVGHTCSDEDVDDRAEQIRRYVAEHGIRRWVAIDDGQPDLSALGDRWIKTESKVGLTATEVALAMARLTRQIW